MRGLGPIPSRSCGEVTALASRPRLPRAGRRRALECQPTALVVSARFLYKGHVGDTLDRLRLPRHQWLKEVDQAPQMYNIREQKDKYLRELGFTHQSFAGIMGKPAEAAVEKHSSEDLRILQDKAEQNENVNQALRMYRLLRPEAPPFYQEDAMLSVQARLNRSLKTGSEGAGASTDALIPGSKHSELFSMQASLPVVNQRAFLLALDALVSSLADDLDNLLTVVLGQTHDIPKDDNLRFKKLVDHLFANVFRLHKDPSKVDEFMTAHWDILKELLPPGLADEQEAVAEWLRGHLTRVRANQRRIQLDDKQILLHQVESHGHEELYSFAEDFPYDNDLMPAGLADERNLDFPLERAAEYMTLALKYLESTAAGQKAAEASAESASVDSGNGSGGEGSEPGVAAQFQDFVWDLDSIGLRNWLKMDTTELERYLPRGKISVKDWSSESDIEDLKEVAKLMLRCAARGKANVLDFEAVDPHQLLHGLPAKPIEEELRSLPVNPHISDTELNDLVEACIGTRAKFQDPTKDEWYSKRHGASIDDVFKKELEFYYNAGPVEWKKEDKEEGWTWKFRQPTNTIWDARRGVYIPEQKGVHPELELGQMRQVMLEMTRMGSMCKNGRIYYFRAVVAVGNGQGIYGFGVGFGNTPKEARSDGSLKALQNLDYIDLDPGRMLAIPCRGLEYSQQVFILPRPIGRGLRANKKHMPLLYILGLDNVRVRFFSPTMKWFVRQKALKRALDMMISRRTLANMTGKRHALLVAPGDHWVHWPDAWFKEQRKPYDDNAARMRLLRRMVLHKGRRGNKKKFSTKELKPGWSTLHWQKWVNPVESWMKNWKAEYPTPSAK